MTKADGLPCEELTIENSVFTCTHVMNGTEKYEYVPAGIKEKPDDEESCESFCCSKCLDLNEIDSEEAMKSMRAVCRECFIETRVKKNGFHKYDFYSDGGK